MFLERKFNKINSYALCVEETIYNIYLDYIVNDFEFSSLIFYTIINRYEKMYNDFCVEMDIYSEVLCFLFSKKQLKKLETFYIPHKDFIVLSAVKRIIPIIVDENNGYIPISVENKDILKEKLFNILVDLDIFAIVSVYFDFKKSLGYINEINVDDTFVYLQQIFVYIILYKIANEKNQFIKNKKSWNYEDVCEKILNEPVLSLVKKKKNNLKVLKISLK